MYPENQYMDPYHSHYRNPSPYPYYPPPGWEAGHLRPMDSPYGSPSYGPWAYSAGMHHPHPSEFHCCCNHTYSPGYYSFRPPLPQELPPPHLFYHGPFPQHLNVCPSYFVPPHHYPVDQTPYDLDKFKSHCCGCPNHVCHGGEKSNVKIEEERPDLKPESEHKDADNASIIRHPENQYPFVWLPSGNVEGKENGRRHEIPHQLSNGWVPVSSKKTGDVKQQERDNQKEKQFQWPIVWMPEGYDEPKQKVKRLKEMDESPKVSEEAPRSPRIKIIPLSLFENGHPDHKQAAKDGSGEATTEHQDGAAMEENNKTAPYIPNSVNDERKPSRENYKTIPVVPRKETDEKKVGTYRTIPVMTQKESDEKKHDVSENIEVKKASYAEKKGENGKTNNNESSVAKHSKLPPVCLRVDPLPRKKSGNGSSRSPSPPTRKDADKAKKDMNEAQSQKLEPKHSDTNKHNTLSEAIEKSPSNEMKKGMHSSNETVQAASAKHSQEEVPTSKDDSKVQTNSYSVDTQQNAGAKSLHDGDAQENAGAEILQGGDKSTNDDKIIIQSEAAKDDAGTCRTNLSEVDAAVHVQSAYRGYSVRRWQPLDKLRKIRDVHEQMQGVRKQLQYLEASSKKPTGKEQVVIGETIMNLLLKLDTIQGLHPSVREARKSVARELICLQEKLDTLCKQPSAKLNHANSEEEKPERAESVIRTAAPTLTAEASDKEKAVGLDEAEESSPVDSVELCDAVPSGVSMDVGLNAVSSEQKHKKEESYTTTTEAAHEEGRGTGQVEFQGASSMDMMSDAALLEHPGDHHDHQTEESDVVSIAEVTEEEKAVGEGEGQELPLVDSMEPLHDSASSGDSSGLRLCTASTGQNLHAEEANTGASPAFSTASLDSGLEDPMGGQRREAVGVESPELKHDVSSDEEDQHKESSAPVVNLEGSSVFSKDAEPHEHYPTPTIDSVMSMLDDQPEVGDINIQEQDVDATQDITKEPDETPEASMDHTKLAASAEAENPDQNALLELTSDTDSAREQTPLEESEDAVQCQVSGKDHSPHADQKIEPTGGSANGECPLLEASRKVPDIQESHPNLGEETDDTRAETVFPELDSSELPCVHEGAISGYERPEMKVSSSQIDAQKAHVCLDSLRVDARVSETRECDETLNAPVGATGETSVEEIDQRLSTDGCNDTPIDTRVSATRVNSAGEDEDIAVQTENKASVEALSASATPDSLKHTEEKKLAEENQKLKELLQKLLASGNDQMGVITNLSKKVKVLERKLARKKKPKFRVHRPKPGMRQAKVH